MSVEVVVPWLPGCPYREAAWAWLRPRLEALGWPVVVATHGDGPWVKASVVMPAVEASAADVIVMADADCWTPGLFDAVAAVEAGASWAMPHTLVHRLTEGATVRLLAGGVPWSLEAFACEQPPYPGVWSGGVVVARRDVLLDVPMPIVEGWGSEDHCWGWALACLHGGDPWQAPDPLYHLWHPPAERIDRMNGSYPAQALRRQYFAARNDRPAMRALVEAGRRQWQPRSSSTVKASPSF